MSQAFVSGWDRGRIARSVASPPVQDPRLEIRMLHDRLMVKADSNGERRSGVGIVIPATAEIARRLVWGEVFGVGNHVRTIAGIAAAALLLRAVL